MGAHENWVLGSVFSVDGKRVVSVGRDRAAKLTDASSGAFLENVNLLRGELAAVARHPAKEIVVIGGDDRVPYIYLMDRPEGDEDRRRHDADPQARPAERRDHGAGMVARRTAASRWRARRRRSISTTPRPGARVASCKGHTAGIYTVAFSPDSATLAAGGFDGMVRLYDAASGQLKKEFVPVPLEKTK